MPVKIFFRSGYSRMILILAVALIISSCGSKHKPKDEPEADSLLKKGVILVDYSEKKKVDVYIDGDVFTSYIYPEGVEKPVLFPVRTAMGTEITRRYPIFPRKGERTDNPHQIGIWFNFGDMNGYDFWNFSDTRIQHRGVKRAESREDLGVLEIAVDWQVPGDEGRWHTLLQENTVFEFSGDEYNRTIDRITQLTAQEDEIVFSDNKEGLFAIRVARELELPSDKATVFTDKNGNPMAVERIDKEGVNGDYLNSEGVRGNETFGNRARWTRLASNIGEEKISVTIFDHPENSGYPSYWHSTGYGLFAINNLGAYVYNDTDDPVSVRLLPGESIVFKHRMYITSGSLPAEDELEACFKEFSKK